MFVLVLQFLVLVLSAVDLCAEGLLLDVCNPLALQQVFDDQQLLTLLYHLVICETPYLQVRALRMVHHMDIEVEFYAHHV